MAEECSGSSPATTTPCDSDTDSFNCNAYGYYGEGGESCRSDDPISWQHFPRSTSTRSRCDESSMEIIPDSSYPDISCKSDDDRKESKSSIESSTIYPITKSIAQLNAEHYLKIRNIHGLFNFLIGHLICAEPEDPIEYLINILERCLNFRDYGGEEPALLVSEHHIKSLYKTFDIYGKGYITVDQYETAMVSIGLSKGLTQPTRNPPLNEKKMVDEKFFISEALRCLKNNFFLMFRIPKDWEENRLVWKAIMMKRCQKMIQNNSNVEQLKDNDSKASSTCEYEIKEEDQSCCTSLRSRELRHEPEQLFLTS